MNYFFIFYNLNIYIIIKNNKSHDSTLKLRKTAFHVVLSLVPAVLRWRWCELKVCLLVSFSCGGWNKAWQVDCTRCGASHRHSASSQELLAHYCRRAKSRSTKCPSLSHFSLERLQVPPKHTTSLVKCDSTSVG